MTERQKEYHKYLASEDWKRRGSALRDLYKNKCAACSKTEQLNLHHLNYDCLGKETVRDVVLLCKGCHLKAHRGRLRVWFFSAEQFEAYLKIKHIITDDMKCDYISFIIKQKEK